MKIDDVAAAAAAILLANVNVAAYKEHRILELFEKSGIEVDQQRIIQDQRIRFDSKRTLAIVLTWTFNSPSTRRKSHLSDMRHPPTKLCRAACAIRARQQSARIRARECHSARRRR